MIESIEMADTDFYFFVGHRTEIGFLDWILNFIESCLRLIWWIGESIDTLVFDWIFFISYGTKLVIEQDNRRIVCLKEMKFIYLHKLNGFLNSNIRLLFLNGKPVNKGIDRYLDKFVFFVHWNLKMINEILRFFFKDKNMNSAKC